MPAAEQLQLGPPEPPAGRRRGRVIGAVLAVVLVVAVGLNLRAAPDQIAGPPPTPPSWSSPTPSAGPASTRGPAGPDPRPREIGVARPIVGGPTPWVVYAHSERTVYRIDLRSGRVVARAARSSVERGAELVPVAGGVVLRSYDGLGHYLPDGRPARRLTGLLARPGSVLPGPGGRVWFIGDPGGATPTLATLVDVDGTAAGPVRRGFGGFARDGAGGLLLQDAGGAWELTADEPRRITAGSVIAVGRRHYLLGTCDARHRCRSALRDRKSGTTRRLAILRNPSVQSGTIAPDGRSAALASYRPDAGAALTLWDLKGERPLTVLTDPSEDYAPAYRSSTWSPDGRWLATTRGGRLLLVDARSGRTVLPALPLEFLDQVAGAPPP